MSPICSGRRATGTLPRYIWFELALALMAYQAAQPSLGRHVSELSWLIQWYIYMLTVLKGELQVLEG